MDVYLCECVHLCADTHRSQIPWNKLKAVISHPTYMLWIICLDSLEEQEVLF